MTTAESGNRGGVIAMFGERAKRSAHAPAVVDETGSWTYAELDRRANAVASSLTARGVGRPGALITVVMRNSASLIAVLLGVLKSGAGYVPVSRDDPDERIAGIVTDSKAALVITDDGARLANATRSTETVGVGELIRDGPRGLQRPFSGTAGTDPSLEDIAYVIYTSGSTGAPKGVVISHAALAAYLRVAKSAYPALSGRCLLHSSISFDMAVTSVFGPLVSGGTIVIRDLLGIATDVLPPDVHKPTFLKVTPSHLPLLEALPAEFSPSELLVIGGEALYGETLHSWWDRHPEVVVINEYGPTEATVGCCLHRVEPDDHRGNAVPIGESTNGTRLYVLDDQGREVQDGVTGELHIAGSQLAIGYLHNAALTAESFLPDPFGPGGSMMYRTGDLVRRQSRGALEFVGRKDDQVKIDGYRVEPCEVESALLRSGMIAQAAVLATDTQSGSKRLCAFVRPFDGTVCDTVALRKAIEAVLPTYMVPSSIAVVSDYKLTSNGKLDRANLVADEQKSVKDNKESETETDLLCRLVSEVTGATYVGVDDDFLELGGSSVSAAQLVSLARKAGVNIALMEVLRHRTVRRILARARTGRQLQEEKGNDERTGKGN